jgi:hypothetical protein
MRSLNFLITRPMKASKNLCDGQSRFPIGIEILRALTIGVVSDASRAQNDRL